MENHNTIRTCRVGWRILLMLVMALGLFVPEVNAQSAVKKLTKEYKDVPLSEVLADIEKRTGYTIDYSAAAVDMNQTVTYKGKDVSASSALKKILGKQFIVKAKKNIIYVTDVPKPAETYQVAATTPSAVQEDEEKTVTIYEDTTFSIKCRTMSRQIGGTAIAPKEEEPTAKGHYIQALIGGGYGTMGYQLKDPVSGDKQGSVVGTFSGQLQLQYAYYFHENWGFNIGLAMSGYGSNSRLNNTTDWAGQGDTDGELYTHRAVTHDWKEKQITHIAELPIGIQCMYPISQDKQLRMYAGLGARIGMPVYNQWQLRSGSVEHQGWYPQWNMLITNQEDRDFYTEQIQSKLLPEADMIGAYTTNRKDLVLSPIAVTATADLGLAMPLSKQVDLLFGIYFHMNCLDLYKGNKQSLGFAHTDFTGEKAYRNHSFMNMYDGMLNTNLSTAVRPWAAGIKIGIQWHHVKKQKTPQPKPVYEQWQQCDTTYTLTRREEVVMKPKAVAEIKRLMEKAVIWFDVNSTTPKLEPADILDRIVEVLKANPEQKIIVSGHASKEGNPEKNRILSEKRAQVVADMLIEKGVKAEQIKVEAHAADIEYHVSEGQEHTISLDRRTEIIPID